MKIAIVTDTHWGVRNDSPAFLDASKRFVDDVLLPVVDAEEIRTMLHLGDLTDRRKYINYNTAQRLRTDFIDPIVRRGIDFHITLGNHDVYWKSTMDVNSLEELYHSMTGIGGSDLASFKWYARAEEVTFDGLKVLLVPWICEQNKE